MFSWLNVLHIHIYGISSAYNLVFHHFSFWEESLLDMEVGIDHHYPTVIGERRCLPVFSFPKNKFYHFYLDERWEGWNELYKYSIQIFLPPGLKCFKLVFPIKSKYFHLLLVYLPTCIYIQYISTQWISIFKFTFISHPWGSHHYLIIDFINLFRRKVE